MNSNRERCELHRANNLEAWCTRESCIYWRLLEAQDQEVSNTCGCGLQHFDVFDGLNPEMAAWLLRIKKKLESSDPDLEKSRIKFRRREQ